jgi:putative membrane protein
MRWLRQGLTLLLAIGAVTVGALFSLQNTQPVPLDLMVLQLAPQPVAIWILLALALGVMIGLLAGAWLSLRRAATNRQLRKQRDRLLAAAEKGANGDSE